MRSTYLEPPKQPTDGRSGVYHFNCGEEDAWALFDHSIWGEPIQQFAVGVADSTIAELMERHFLAIESVAACVHAPAMAVAR
jgi:hypothetical protein